MEHRQLEVEGKVFRATQMGKGNEGSTHIIVDDY